MSELSDEITPSNDLNEDVGTQFYTTAGIKALEESISDYKPLDVYVESFINNIDAPVPFALVETHLDTVRDTQEFSSEEDLLGAIEDRLSTGIEAGNLLNIYVDGRNTLFNEGQSSQDVADNLSESFHDTPIALAHILPSEQEAASVLDMKFLYETNSQTHMHIDHYMRSISDPGSKELPYPPQSLPETTQNVVALMQNQMSNGEMTLELAQDYLRMVHGTDQVEHPGFLFAKDGIVMEHLIGAGHGQSQILLTESLIQNMVQLSEQKVMETGANQVVFYHNQPYATSNPSEADYTGIATVVEYFQQSEQLSGIEMHNWVVGPYQPPTVFQPITLGSQSSRE